MSDSVWPHRWQPTRLPSPWDSPPLWYIPRNKYDRLYGNSLFKVSENTSLFSKLVEMPCIPTVVCEGSNFSTSSPQLVIIFFNSQKWYLTVVLIAFPLGIMILSIFWYDYWSFVYIEKEMSAQDFCLFFFFRFWVPRVLDLL